MQALIGNILDRRITDAGYRGHNAPPDHKFKVYMSGQKRRITPQIKREFKRRAAIEPVIGHPKEHHRMGRNYLAHASGDAINAVLAAAGHNFRLRCLGGVCVVRRKRVRQRRLRRHVSAQGWSDDGGHVIEDWLHVLAWARAKSALGLLYVTTSK